jgi:hypothetical protein
MKDGWCLNNSQGKSKIIILPLLMESRVQTDCWQTSLIDHTFYCSSDYWQWSNCAHARLHITSTTAFRWDYSFGVGYEIWMMLSLPSKQFPRLEQNHHLPLLMKSRVQTDCWLTSWIDHTFYCTSDYWQWSICAHMPSCALPRRLDSV